MISRNGLLRSGNQVIVISLLFRPFAFDLVKRLIEIAELGSLGHDLSFHKERRLNWDVIPFCQEGESIIQKGVVKKDSRAFQEVASMSGNLLASSWIISSDTMENLMVMKTSELACDLNPGYFLTPSPFNLVFFLIFKCRDAFMDKISNRIHESIDH